ncbi:glycosyltransferase family 2 protein [Candidatus Soleaferrea massiliensis]|uniref:glycosyltransferase family 2 protein n=1 Tax=Candidatus Soleaferrea massiliensis TaxID=1470354 RepID=UPI0005903FED|nr:glycosyltransferase family 2 protein [Candidatus Soleaferrea massiliensis]
MGQENTVVSFLVIAKNAESLLPALLDSLKAQTYPHHLIQCILVDSASEDGTRRIMENFGASCQDEFAGILVLDNPGMILPCGWNVALRQAKGDLIVRVDAHCTLDPDFIANDVAGFERGEKIIGGPRKSVVNEEDPWQRTLLTAEESLFGSGIAAYRHSEETKYVSTLAHGAYAREVFETVGGYDERLARTEDNEMHYRMRKAGYRLFFDSKVRSYHHPRNRFSKMLKQKYQNGNWIGLTLGVSPNCFSLYHFMPLCFVLAVLAALILAICGIWQPLAGLGVLYGVMDVILTILSSRGKKLGARALLLPFMFFLLHAGYGVGTLFGIIKLPFWRLRKENRSCTAMEEVRRCLIDNRRRKEEASS